MVLSWAELRNERATEIMAQIDPQYAFLSSIVYMHPDRTRRTFELINILLQFCVYVEMRFKHALACWRPVEYNAQVQPMITTRGMEPSRADMQPRLIGSACAESAAEPQSANESAEAGIPNGDRSTRSPGGTHRDQPCHCGCSFSGRQHGGTHAWRGPGRIFHRTLHAEPNL